MRKIISCITVVGLGLGALSGCGQQDDPHAELARAVETISQADRGASADPEPTALSLLTSRQEALDEAIVDLEAAIQKGEGVTAAAARRLLADVHASSSRHLARQAMEQYSGLMARSVTLTAYVRAVDMSGARATRLGQDESAIREQLQEEIRKQQQSQEQYRKQAQELQARMQTFEQERDKFADASRAAMAEMTRLNGEAFMAEGDAQYALADQAAQAQRRAEEAAAAIETQQVEIDLIQAQLSVLQAQLTQLDKVLDDLSAQVEQRRQREQQREQQRTVADEDRTAAAEQLATEFEQTWSVFQRSVDEPLTEAADRLDTAVDQLAQAVNQSPGTARAHAELAQLGMQVEKAHVLANHLLVTDGMDQLLSMLLEGTQRRLGRQQIEQFTTAREALAARPADLTTEAQQVVEQGLTLAAALIGRGGSGVGESAQVYSDRLTAFRQSLQRTNTSASAAQH